MGELMKAFTPLADSKLGRGFLRLSGIDPNHISEPLKQADELLESMTRSILVFTPLGWAPSRHLPPDHYANALGVYERTQSVEQAEDCLVEGWNEGDRLHQCVMRTRSLGREHEPLSRMFMRRAHFVDRALKHHKEGAYEASVPIVLAQIDGVVFDLTESRFGFFGRKKGKHLVDEVTVAGLPLALASLRKLFSEDMRESGMTGRLARSGILHGRELAYDTRSNSTKVFVLLLAVIEWAEPRARDLAESKEREREERFAGSQETDEQGRRLDTRGFKDAKRSLQWLGTMQMGQWRNHNRYGSHLKTMAPGDLGDKMLLGRDEITLRVSADGTEFWAWRSTPSGFCFGIAGRGGPPNEWLYAGAKPPAGGIGEDEWRGVWEMPDLNWE